MRPRLINDPVAIDLLAQGLKAEGGTAQRLQGILDNALARHAPDTEALMVFCSLWRHNQGRLETQHLTTATRSGGGSQHHHSILNPACHDAVERSLSRLLLAFSRHGQKACAGTVRSVARENRLDSDGWFDRHYGPLGIRDFRLHTHAAPDSRIVSIVCPIRQGAADEGESTQWLMALLARILAPIVALASNNAMLAEPSRDLSKAQRAVLDLALKGMTEKQIAVRLHRSHHTVHSHLRSIYRRYKVSSRAELLALLLD
ncbi:Bacterial regulatory protein, luxR family [Pseudobythopirellula maris]|uniref:Bacterial regulatory protein, luxR family n=1 Tax=Pseudobythopirellula maris TaxID=2527991 RepID=A0A5C5ZM60_9BACT|nr:helix-turn-helix transcriptional regulator [Pseudobythopirellula maris]TWT88265.1 Bacterial regulatory protein, luxR family [Pseudobythopirellula maris]